jgi:hypothetical protein
VRGGGCGVGSLPIRALAVAERLSLRRRHHSEGQGQRHVLIFVRLKLPPHDAAVICRLDEERYAAGCSHAGTYIPRGSRGEAG